MNQELIKQLRGGKIAVRRDGVPNEDMWNILHEAFPKDSTPKHEFENKLSKKSVFSKMTNNYYHHEWFWDNTDNLPEVSAKDFLEEFKNGDRVQAYIGCAWLDSTFIGMFGKSHIVVLDESYDSGTFNNFIYSVHKIRKIKESLEITVKLNGKDIEPSTLSEESWKNLRK